MKKLIVFIIFLSFATLLYGQERITFTTTRAPGSLIRLSINAASADQSNVWIDLNNNGQRDSGEEVTTFANWSGSSPQYTVQSQTITIYGKVTAFGAAGGGLTALDLTNNPHLTFLRLDDNSIEELDLSALPKEFYNLHISKNKITGELDVSHLEGLQTMNIDRNYLTSVTMGTHPKLGQNVNISRNLLSEAAIDAVLAAVPDRTGATLGNFYVIDTRTNDPQYEEGNRLKQHHLGHRVFGSYNWRILDVNGTTNFSDITRLTNRYTTSFTTAKSSGGNLTLNIDAEECDHPSVWIDLNNNGVRDQNEAVTSFGSDVSYTVSSNNIAVYGLASRISAANNELTKFNASKNPFLGELNIAVNSFTVAELNKFIETLIDRTATTSGSLTLIDFEGDANQVISEHITGANAKNWQVKDATGRILSPSDIVSLQQTMRNLKDIATYPGQVVTLSESTDQGLAVTYTAESGKENVVKIEGNILTALAYGEVVVTVTQAGNDLYEEFSTTITVTVVPIGETFNWLGVPTIGVIGNNVFVAGPQEVALQFTKFYINNVLVELVEGNADISDYEGNIELKATNEDGTQIIRLVIEK